MIMWSCQDQNTYKLRVPPPDCGLQPGPGGGVGRGPVPGQEEVRRGPRETLHHQRHVLQVLAGAVLLARAVLPRRRDARHARIVAGGLPHTVHQTLHIPGSCDNLLLIQSKSLTHLVIVDKRGFGFCLKMLVEVFT